MNNYKGYTTIELVITLVIAMIMMSFALGPIRDLMLRMQMSDQATLFQLDLNYARQEAVNRSYPITVSPNESWVNGWVIFEDRNGDGVMNNNDEQLRESAYKDDSFKLVDSGQDAPITFTRFGSLQTPVERVINLSHEDTELVKMVITAAAGSVSIRTDEDGNNG